VKTGGIGAPWPKRKLTLLRGMRSISIAMRSGETRVFVDQRVRTSSPHSPPKYGASSNTLSPTFHQTTQIEPREMAIQPDRELVKRINEWVQEPEPVCKEEFREIVRISLQKVLEIAERARQLGAEQELAACCEWLKNHYDGCIHGKLKYARTPKPPSLKEQALEALDSPVWGPEQKQIVLSALQTLNG